MSAIHKTPAPSGQPAAGNDVTMVAMIPQWFKASTVDLPLALGSELLRFAAHRMQVQAEFWATLARCNSLPQVAEAQSSFAQEAVSEYTTEIASLIKTAQDNISAQAA
ncbi:phasin family protein [Chelatococcus sp. SYSU_G07232]|uniref:Phasin family protein n=1 Tax=Chelatococcus albus TaxID=3047466 RepID=A0ABT7AKU7_9HYPH|nr:phasin family protein [Chelatococcus sp. SYSU_G07232]MDJ1160006.1 phasin family protein [Chelatococcus sp. SYSU_G07232]